MMAKNQINRKKTPGGIRAEELLCTIPPDLDSDFKKVEKTRAPTIASSSYSPPPEELNTREELVETELSLKKEVEDYQAAGDDVDMFQCEAPETDSASKELLNQHNKQSHSKQEKRMKKYTYGICGLKKFYSHLHLEDHKRIVHNGEKPSECQICGKKYVMSKYLLKHEEKCSNERLGARPFECGECGKKFRTHMDLHQHTYCHSPFVCNICGSRLKSSSELEGHKEIHVKSANSLTRNLESGLDNNLLELPSAQKNMESVSSFKCPECKLGFPNRNMLNQHCQYRHRATHKQELYVCNVCWKTFESQLALETHQKLVHSAEKRLECEYCGKLFSWAQTLKRHADVCGMKHRLGVDNNEKLFPCQKCGIVFTDPRNLKMHEHRLHSGFFCDTCGQVFPHASELYSHKRGCQTRPPSGALMEISDSDKSLSTCTSTDNETVSVDGVKAVQEASPSTSDPLEDIMIFQCGACEKAFGTEDLLDKHLCRRHERKQKRLHSSTIREAEFGSQPRLISLHCQSHSLPLIIRKSKPTFFCKICEAKFTRRTSLDRHVSTVHDSGRQYGCDICGQRFTILDKFKDHMQIHKILASSASNEETDSQGFEHQLSDFVDHHVEHVADVKQELF